MANNFGLGVLRGRRRWKKEKNCVKDEKGEGGGSSAMGKEIHLGKFLIAQI